MKKFNLIVACNLKGVIGNNNRLLYHIKSDLMNFSRITKNSVVLMGRKTYESLPKGALPNRINIVITRNKAYQGENIIVVETIEKAIALCESNFKDKEWFVIGGRQIYKEFLDRDLIETIYMTQIYDSQDGDTLFPLNKNDLILNWRLFYESLEQIDDGNKYKFAIYKFVGDDLPF